VNGKQEVLELPSTDFNTPSLILKLINAEALMRQQLMSLFTGLGDRNEIVRSTDKRSLVRDRSEP
jgi:hypothetical protein